MNFLKFGTPKIGELESKARNARARSISRFIVQIFDQQALNESPKLAAILDHGLSESIKDFLRSNRGKQLVERIISIRANTPEDIIKSGGGSVWFRSFLPVAEVHSMIFKFLRRDLLDVKLKEWFDDFGIRAAALGRLGVNAQAAQKYSSTTLARLGKMFVVKQDDMDDSLRELSLALAVIVDAAKQDPALLAIVAQRWNKIMGEPPFTIDEFESVMTHITEEFFEAGHGARDLANALLTDSTLRSKLVGTPIANRALLIARTEVSILQGEAAQAAISEAGFQLKEWMTAGDLKVRDRHLDNESDGAIPVDKAFSDGSMNTGFGNLSPYNCRCDMIGVVQPGSPVPGESNDLGEEF